MWYRFQFKTRVETVSHRLYNTLTAIQMDDVEDTRGWTLEIDEWILNHCQTHLEVHHDIDINAHDID